MIIDVARQLNQAILESEEYRCYQDARRKVLQNVELYQAMNAFRRKNYELQNVEDGLNHYEDIRNLTKEYEQILKHPLVNDFLRAEQIISRKMNKVYEVIVEGVDMDYDYME
ncbi:MAG: YlbF family regulator [Eubacteriales bacterium]|nr:YlbF family regulator [Eubacteriales bacterium]